MSIWWWKKRAPSSAVSFEQRVRFKYASFRELLSLNHECLELMAGLQEDLQFVPPRRDVVGSRITAIYDRVERTVAALEKLAGHQYPLLRSALEEQRGEVERHIAVIQELATPRLSAWLSELGPDSMPEVGGKAAALGEIRNQLGLPVPDGYVLTTEAYRQFCGIPLWELIRDRIRRVDLADLDGLKAISAELQGAVLSAPVPRAIEVAIRERARKLDTAGLGLAVRSSAVGEGGEHTYAGQFVSLINVPPDEVVDAFRRVVAGRFSERALFYRLSTGLLEVESPMAVLFLPVIPAAASGIMYTRDPGDAGSKSLWVTATRGLGLDIASGRMPADLFVVSRGRRHEVLERNVVHKGNLIEALAGGGLGRTALDERGADSPSLADEQIRTLAEWGLRIEHHFGCPQDIEWAIDDSGAAWILQARPLALAGQTRARPRPKGEPVLSGGRTVYPGRVSGEAFMLEDLEQLSRTPEGAILFLRRASPEIIEVFPRIGGLVAEWGNVAGHAAALLREFKVPSVFQMKGAFEMLRPGEAVSLDAARCQVHRGKVWSARVVEVTVSDGLRESTSDPVGRRLLTLNLLDPAASNFRPAGCKSTHDVLRFCHEKAIETMFAINDFAMQRGPGVVKQLVSDVPVHLYVLDLGGGLRLENPATRTATPEQIVSRPFQALWKGVSHPAVTWTRQMPAGLSDLASVMAGSFTSQAVTRALGEESYLIVADEYMNLNSRLAYHFSLVDACLGDEPAHNYISFRFSGGGATRHRRNLRACFIERCLEHYGFRVDRRGDLVNAWFKKAPADATASNLDTLGRLMACSSQLDMYMTSHEVMEWYIRQFLEGNYRFEASPRAD